MTFEIFYWISRSSAYSVECMMGSLDFNHTCEHVTTKFKQCHDLESVRSHCINNETVVEDLPARSFPLRHWDVGNNPKTAVHEWLKSHPELEIEKNIGNKLIISVAPDG